MVSSLTQIQLQILGSNIQVSCTMSWLGSERCPDYCHLGIRSPQAYRTGRGWGSGQRRCKATWLGGKCKAGSEWAESLWHGKKQLKVPFLYIVQSLSLFHLIFMSTCDQRIYSKKCWFQKLMRFPYRALFLCNCFFDI